MLVDAGVVPGLAVWSPEPDAAAAAVEVEAEAEAELGVAFVTVPGAGWVAGQVAGEAAAGVESHRAELRVLLHTVEREDQAWHKLQV
jgi:hypothetical protein